MKLPIITLAALLVTAACSDPVDCTSEFRYGISVRVEDSVSDANAVSGARLVLRDGAYAESTDESIVGLLYGAGERAGTYNVTVQKPTYRDWTRTNVQVTADACHVNRVGLTARLQPI